MKKLILLTGLLFTQTALADLKWDKSPSRNNRAKSEETSGRYSNGKFYRSQLAASLPVKQKVIPKQQVQRVDPQIQRLQQQLQQLQQQIAQKPRQQPQQSIVYSRGRG